MAGSKKNLGVFALVMMNVAAVLSLRSLPMMAEEGLTMFFYILFTTVFFLIPVCLVCAELAAGWPENGGVFRWVSQAMGPKLGFVAIWIQWVQNVVWFPTILGFAAGSLSYLFMRPHLADNNLFTTAVILVVFWGATFISFLGSQKLGFVASLGVILGTMLPGILLIGLGVIFMGGDNTIEFLVKPKPFMPDLGNFASVAFLAAIVLQFAGMEVNAVYVKEMSNPGRQFPASVFLSALIIVLVFAFGSLAVAAVVPADKINLDSGLMQCFEQLLTHYNMSWLLPILGLCTAFGAVGGVVVWVSGPSRGLLATAQEGYLPPFLQKVNKRGVQVHILAVQGVIVSIVSLIFLFVPNVSTAVFLISTLSVAIYLIMYGMIYISFLILRYREPDTKRAYRVPGGMAGAWIVCLVGGLAVMFAFVVGFFPPVQLPVKNPSMYVGIMVVGTLIFVLLPILILKLARPSWKEYAQKHPIPQDE